MGYISYFAMRGVGCFACIVDIREYDLRGRPDDSAGPGISGRPEVEVVWDWQCMMTVDHALVPRNFAWSALVLLDLGSSSSMRGETAANGICFHVWGQILSAKICRARACI